MARWLQSAVIVALSTLGAIASAEVITAVDVEECGPMELIELSMVEPQIADCAATSPFVQVAATSSFEARAEICDDKTLCGKLLPYMAFMKKNMCSERLAHSIFADELLSRCEDFPYKNIDPKWILIGKARKPTAKEGF